MFTILIVGDVHRCWRPSDESAIRVLAPDLLFFVGDYGDEALDVVQRIARFGRQIEATTPTRVCAVLGNHEAIRYAYDASVGTEAIRQQKDALAALNPSESPRKCAGVSIVGGRPFSSGGKQFGRFAHVYQWAGITCMQDSIQRLVHHVHGCTSPLLFLSHNGPSGLGDSPHSICGNDYEVDVGDRGDRGDPDLRAAIEEARDIGLRVPLVAFGHFHRVLNAGQGLRQMVVVEEYADSRSTLMVNAAFVPRHRRTDTEALHHFIKVVCDGPHYDVQTVDEIWVTGQGVIRETTRHYEKS